MNERKIAAVLLIALPFLLHAQEMSDQDALDQMKYDVQYLSSDLLEGREAGTKGEKLAADYITGKFSSIGLMPYGDSASYRQGFPFAALPELGPANRLQLGRKKLKHGTDFAVLPYSASAEVRGKVLNCLYGIRAPELDYDDYKGQDVKGRIVGLSISSPDGIHPHSKYLAHHDLRDRVEQAVALGAVGVIFYNDDPTAQDPAEQFMVSVQPSTVPVLFLKGELHESLLVDNNPCVIGTDIVRATKTAYNIVGLLDNGRKNVVVIGAHYDHLGYGSEGSLHRGEAEIHNGADDNASGVAVMLQLARDLSVSDAARENDYLFIAFSGEEKGLYGSGYWTKNPTVPLSELNYMINLDMVGRLDSAGRIGINGVGTSPAWAEVERILVGDLKVKTTESGIGPSDHTSFYLKDIPAIHFFTGTHNDYHKPGDDEEKINYPGMLRVVRYIESLIATLNDDGKLAFQKTKDEDNSEVPRFTVTLGVVPDYMFDGTGMRIDGITEGKPAANAGLKAGDVVTRMGEVEVTDMMAYMKALSLFKKGDTAPVRVLREGKEMDVQVTF